MPVSFVALLVAVSCTPHASLTSPCGPLLHERIRVESVAQASTHSALERPVLLSALYVTYAGVQALDVYTTAQSLRAGGREANPLLAPLSGDLVVVSAVKAASTVGTIYFVNRLWRRHRVTAVILMAGLNGAVGAAASYNARVARRARSHSRGVR